MKSRDSWEGLSPSLTLCACAAPRLCRQCRGVSLQPPGLCGTPLLICAPVPVVSVPGEGLKALPHEPPEPHQLHVRTCEAMNTLLMLSQELLGWWQSLFPALGEAPEREELV